jgi:hypothetical protein
MAFKTDAYRNSYEVYGDSLPDAPFFCAVMKKTTRLLRQTSAIFSQQKTRRFSATGFFTSISLARSA